MDTQKIIEENKDMFLKFQAGIHKGLQQAASEEETRLKDEPPSVDLFTGSLRTTGVNAMLTIPLDYLPNLSMKEYEELFSFLFSSYNFELDISNYFDVGTRLIYCINGNQEPDEAPLGCLNVHVGVELIEKRNFIN